MRAVSRETPPVAAKLETPGLLGRDPGGGDINFGTMECRSSGDPLVKELVQGFSAEKL